MKLMHLILVDLQVKLLVLPMEIYQTMGEITMKRRN